MHVTHIRHPVDDLFDVAGEHELGNHVSVVARRHFEQFLNDFERRQVQRISSARLLCCFVVPLSIKCA